MAVVAIMVVSDTCALHHEEDQTAPALKQMLHSLATNVTVEYVPDEIEEIRSRVEQLCKNHELVLTTGGTGFGVRDVTPEAVSPLLEKQAPGLISAMMINSLTITPKAALSRPVAGVCGSCLIVTLPGSPKGALENYEAIRSVIPHALRLLQGDSSRKLHESESQSHAHGPKYESEANGSKHGYSHDQKHVHTDDAHTHNHYGHSHTHGHGHGHGHDGPKFYGPAHRRRQSPYEMISFDKALSTVLENTPEHPRIRKLPLEDSLGYVLAEDVRAPLNVPPFRASVVDGYAVVHTDCPGVLPLSRVATASSSLATFVPKSCVRITTGAPVPHGATAVVPVENTVLVEERDGEEVSIRIDAEGVKPGDNVREIGSDISLGDPVLSKGTRITQLGGEIGVLASIGVAKVHVYAQPVVGVLSTGNELVPVDAACYGSQIWDANRPMLLANLRSFLGRESVVDLGIVRDDTSSVEDALLKALGSVDILVTTGGVSMGELDLLKPTIEQLGGRIHFGRVAMKPGKPVTFATLQGKYVFALPGNPVSAAVCLQLFVIPAINRWSGGGSPSSRVPVTLDSEIILDSRPEFHRVHLEMGPSGVWRAISTGFQRSSRISSLVQAHALLCLPGSTPEQSSLPAGTLVDAILLS